MPARPPEVLRAAQGQMSTLYVTELKQFINILFRVSCKHCEQMKEGIAIPVVESFPKDGTCLVAWFRDKRFLGLWTQR